MLPRLGWVMTGLFLVLLSAGLYLQAVTLRANTATGSANSGYYLRFVAQGGMSLVGAFLISRRPRHPVGWLFAIVPVVTAIEEFAYGYAYYGTVTNPGAVPLPGLAILFMYVTSRQLNVLPLTFLFLIFPDGRYAAPRWQALAWVAVGMMILYVTAALIAPVTPEILNLPIKLDLVPFPMALREQARALTWFSLIGNILIFFAALFSLLLRLRRSRGVERQQLKWFVYSGSFFVVGIPILVLGLLFESPLQQWLFPTGVFLVTIFLVGLPVASAIAILRYRLWDIDLLINRTLVYGGLTATLGAVYLVSVVVFQRLFPGSSQLSVVVSTLLVAGLFAPLRRRIQNDIDRRFYRQRYSAQQMLQSFGVQMSHALELDQLCEALMDTVAEALHPQGINLWLTEDSESGGPTL